MEILARFILFCIVLVIAASLFVQWPVLLWIFVAMPFMAFVGWLVDVADFD